MAWKIITNRQFLLKGSAFSLTQLPSDIGIGKLANEYAFVFSKLCLCEEDEEGE